MWWRAVRGHHEDVSRARDWVEQARCDLRHARGSLGLEGYAWAGKDPPVHAAFVRAFPCMRGKGPGLA